MLISLVVPCYNEEESLPIFYKEASKIAQQMGISHGADFEFIFVDDGSKDRTLQIARELHRKDARVRYISFSRNFGKEAGIYAGLKAAKGDYVATMDADLQDPPSLLPEMLELLHGRDIKVELRSVNARFFEYSSRLPRSCAFLEDKLKKLVASKVSRGKVELSLSIQTVTAADTVVTVNWQLAEGYRAALNAMAERMDLKNDVSVGMLSRFPDVLTQTAAPTNEDELWEDVRTVAEQAVDAFVAMRAVEGEKMKADVAGRLTTIETLVAKIEENSAGRVQAYSDKLYARLQELLGDRSIDEGRLVTEAAIFADKTAIDEETVRLHSHVAQYREILELDEPIGRKLDFLTQELNRESNTIGSKCQDVAITRLVVELKSEIEKIREQIQNIE